MKRIIIFIWMLLFLLVPALAEPNFIFEDIKHAFGTVSLSDELLGDGSVPEQYPTYWDATIINYGEYGCMNVELGIYDWDWLIQAGYNDLSLFGSDTVVNCVPGEYNVQTKNVCLLSGERKTERFRLITPLIDEDEVEISRDYGVAGTTYLRCWSYQNQNTGQTDSAKMQIAIRSRLLAGLTGDSATCSDNQMNQDETDIDCGGSLCIGCKEGRHCETSIDCISGMKCADADNRNDFKICRSVDEISLVDSIEDNGLTFISRIKSNLSSFYNNAFIDTFWWGIVLIPLVIVFILFRRYLGF